MKEFKIGVMYHFTHGSFPFQYGVIIDFKFIKGFYKVDDAWEMRDFKIVNADNLMVYTESLCDE